MEKIAIAVVSEPPSNSSAQVVTGHKGVRKGGFVLRRACQLGASSWRWCRTNESIGGG